MLLAVSYLHRSNPNAVKNVARSSSYIHAVSNRLGASVPRARYLGMITGVALSRLVDEPGKVMDFGAEEMDSQESKAWLDLVNVDDKIGSVELLHSTHKNDQEAVKEVGPQSKQKPKSRPAKQPPTSKIIPFEEVEDSEPEDDDLVPYQKPDDDLSDSEEDPTLIDRSKPAAPVYIIGLIKGLNVSDNPEVVQLALKTAPSLIRRKTGFGTELPESIDKLASSLLNLSEGMSKADPQKLRLQSLIACVVAQPHRMGPWLASTYFEGDFSLVQRATLLTTIGLGARELAGHTDDPALATPKETFPSKRLPEKFSAIYAPVDAITSDLSRTTLQPMALAAADTLTGPDILKVRTFSSRLEVEKKSKQKSKERSTRIPKDLHRLLTESFYLPLCCRLSLLFSSRPQISRSTLFEPHIFKLFLQTLAILMNTLGPHASQLNTITRETLLVLTQLHNTSTLSLDPAILPPMLQLLLSILDLNIEAGVVAEERLVTDFGQTIAELMAWVAGLQNMSIPTQEGEGMPWNVIAAGCQVKWQEVGRKFQGRMVGLMGGDLDSF
jgi:telomere length regulation protein